MSTSINKFLLYFYDPIRHLVFEDCSVECGLVFDMEVDFKLFVKITLAVL